VAKYDLALTAKDDLRQIWDFIAMDNPTAATRVVEAVYESFATLADTPRIGKPRRFRQPHLADIRSWPVSGFNRYLIFYRPMADGIQVIHVCRDSRNIEALFGEI